MYHSIPGVHKAELLHKDVDYSDIAALANDQQGETEVKVSRSTRISFECHPSVLLADLFDDYFVQGIEEDCFDTIVSMFKASPSKQ